MKNKTTNVLCGDLHCYYNDGKGECHYEYAADLQELRTRYLYITSSGTCGMRKTIVISEEQVKKVAE